MPLKNFEERNGVIICKKCGSTKVRIKALSPETNLRYDIDTVYICENAATRNIADRQLLGSLPFLYLLNRLPNEGFGKMRKEYAILVSALLIVVAGFFAVAGMQAIFTDTEKVGENRLQAGTLDLDLGSTASVKIQVSDMKPGDDTGYYKWKLKNTGTLPGRLYVEFRILANNENGVNEPEAKAGDEGEPGELGQYLKYVIGWGPYGWSVPSKLKGEWQTGPPHPWGTPGLNGLDGQTYEYGILQPGEEIGFFMKLSLDSDLKAWDGTKWINIDDNIIQGDSVEFEIIFHLDQAS